MNRGSGLLVFFSNHNHGKHFRVHYFLIPAVLLMSMFTNAQTMEVGPYFGASYYLGDLNPGTHFKNSQMAYGGILRYNIDTRWAVKISGYYGTVKSSSATSNFLPDRNLAFESKITDIAITTEFNFLSYFTGSHKNFWTPYISAGFSFFMFDPIRDGIPLQSLGTEGQNIGYMGRSPYNKFSFSIPFGLGVKFSIVKNLSASVFWEMHKTFTDYLDDVSTTYYLPANAVDPKVPGLYYSDPSMDHQPLMERGNPNTKDWYSFSGLTLTYKFDLRSHRKCRDTKFM